MLVSSDLLSAPCSPSIVLALVAACAGPVLVAFLGLGMLLGSDVYLVGFAVGTPGLPALAAAV